MPRLRRRAARPSQTLQQSAVQAFRSTACRVGFLVGFSAGCLAVVACLETEPELVAEVLADDAAVERGRATSFSARAR